MRRARDEVPDLAEAARLAYQNYRIAQAAAPYISAGYKRARGYLFGEEEEKTPARTMRRRAGRPMRSRLIFTRDGGKYNLSSTPRRRTPGRVSAMRKRKNVKRRAVYRLKKKKRKYKKSLPFWALKKNIRYMGQEGVVRDVLRFNMNWAGTDHQNAQQYYMTWNYTAADVDTWLAKANNFNTIAEVETVGELLVRKVTSKITIKNAFSHCCYVDVWYIKPRRAYNQSLASVFGVNPAVLTSTETETKFNAFAYSLYGHEPTDDSDFTRLFKIYKGRRVKLEPGQDHSYFLRSRKGWKIYSKIDYGIPALGGFNDHYTIMPHSNIGLLLRVRGCLVHDESKIVMPLEATNTSVAAGGFALDGVQERVCHHAVPWAMLAKAKKQTGYNAFQLSNIQIANESSYGNDRPEVKADA